MGNKKDSLGDRMKGYENISRSYLTRRVRQSVSHLYTRHEKAI